MDDVQLFATSPRQAYMPWATFSHSPEVSDNWSLRTSPGPVEPMQSLYPSLSRDSGFDLGQPNGHNSSIAYLNQDYIPYPDLALQSPDTSPSPSPEHVSDGLSSMPNNLPRRARNYKTTENDASMRKEKKRIQNRIAQKSFRKRKQDYVEALETRIRKLEAELEAHRRESFCFNGVVGASIQDDPVACQS
ncbi:hypothetical protein ASPVEDRAFT_87314 [Aspergillus versicolor CBS 583.65]|uniref:BZIP domain-containing protein n=1 Tax=Aspergillus versicolor CBS 583.65 TaxID=1036611 RepID=A0A1L9PX24_ASPVE|nr:uncharacterized protein ASPVEDRAFT_87314 [Aspergillus versicolor CBS 583.65]OJJ05992.1 hypothetical protein ASPVEDRAFT_87314 [Aspergillus versicolor CBS 583.65]